MRIGGAFSGERVERMKVRFYSTLNALNIGVYEKQKAGH